MYWVKGVYDRGTTVTEVTEPFLVRYEGESLDEILADLEERKVVAYPDAFKTVADYQNIPLRSGTGTFEFRGGMTILEVSEALGNPITQMVRLPEGWWIARSAQRLEDRQVCTAEEYIELANNPAEFADVVSFELPKKSLEGYLYPDTYELPPLLGARGVIVRQLQNFEKRVVKKYGVDGFGEGGLHQVVTLGSLVEVEVALDEERPMVAEVMRNRLEQNMRLQIDATVLYALQDWRKLEAGEVNRVESPYNTYKNNGLPPGPICSPALRSIEAVLNPAEHDYLFYVRGEGMSHLFSSTYDGHLQNIKKSNAIRKAEQEAAAAEEANS